MAQDQDLDRYLAILSGGGASASDDEDRKRYLAALSGSPLPEPTKDSGVIVETGRAVARGFAGKIPEMIGKALQYMGDEPAKDSYGMGSPAYAIGESIRNVGESVSQSDLLKKREVDHGVVGNALIEGAEMIGPSVSGLAFSAIPYVGQAAAATLGPALFGLSQAQDTWEKGGKAGISTEDRAAASRGTGAIEAGGEFLGNMALGRLFGVFGKVLKSSGGDAVEGVFRAYKDPEVMKSFLKNLGVTYGTEVSTEMGQSAGQAAVERAYGIKTEDPWEAAKDAIGPTLAMTTLLAPFGVKAHLNEARNQTVIAGIAGSPDAPADARVSAVKQIFESLRAADPDFAKQWGKYALEQVAAGKRVSLSRDMAVEPSPQPEAAPLALPHITGEPMVVFPDGTTMTRADWNRRTEDGYTGAPTMEEAAATIGRANSVDEAIAAAGEALAAPVDRGPYTGQATGEKDPAFLEQEAARELQRPAQGGEPGLAEIAMQGPASQAGGVISGAPDLGAQQAEAVAKRARGELLSSREVELAKEFDEKPAPKIVIAGRETDVGEASDTELANAANLTRSQATRQIIVEEQRRRQEAPPAEPPRLALPDNRAASGQTLVTFPDGSAMPAAEARARQLQTPDTQAGARKVSVPSSQSQDEALAVKRAAYAAAKASGAPDDIAASMVLNFQEKANERGEPMSVWVNDRDGALGMAPASGAPAWKNGKYVGTFYPDGGKAGKAPASLAPERLAAMTPKGLEAALKQAKTPEAKAAIEAEQQRRAPADIAMAEPGDKPLASTTSRWKEGQEYEGRLFGGAYNWTRVEGLRGGQAAKDAPMRKAIMLARERYNAIRAEFGLAPVTNWRERPPRDQLIQFQQDPGKAQDIAMAGPGESPKASMRADDTQIERHDEYEETPLYDRFSEAEAKDRLRRRLNREPGVGAPKNQRTVLTTKRDGKTFTYVVNPTNADWLNRVEKALTPEELKSAREWYTSLHNTLVPIFGEELAPRIGLAWLLSQVQASPTQGMMNVLRAEDIARGKQKIKQAGLSEEAMVAAIRGADIKGGVGSKLADFLDSEFGTKARTVFRGDRRAGQPAAIDVWSGRDIGYIDGPTMNWIRETFGPEAAAGLQQDHKGGFGPSETQYEYGVDRYNDIKDWLNKKGYMGGGWTASQVQAVGWVAMQKVMGAEPSFVADIIKGNTRRVSLGLGPGSGSALAKALANGELTREQAMAVVRDVADITGVRILSTSPGVGAYLSSIEGSIQIDVLASPESVRDFMDGLGFALQQTEMIATRALKTGNSHAIDLYSPDFADLAKARAWFSEFLKEVPKDANGDPIAPGFQQAEVDGRPALRLLNFFGHWSDGQVAQILSAAETAAEAVGTNLEDGRDFNVNLESTKNDWSENDRGQAYLDSLRNRGRLQEAAELERRYVPQDVARRAAAGEGQLRRDGGQLGGEGASGAVRQEVAPLASRVQTSTPAFKRWFANSSIIDGDGKPMVVYHGSRNDISVFDRLAAKYKLQRETINAIGSWFTTSLDAANTFAGRSDSEELMSGRNIVPAYLSIQNPLYIDTMQEMADLWVKHAGGNERFQGGDPDKFRAWLRGAGYDGMVVEAEVADPGLSRDGGFYIVALEPTQIKSAVGNNGDFDPENPDILASQTFPVPQVSAETPVFNSREQQPDAVTVVGVRYGHEKRTSLNGRSYGKGVPGQESLRIQAERDPELRQRLLNRVYFYAQTADELPRSESIITGNNVSRVKFTNLYDLAADPRGLYAQAKRETDNQQDAANRVEQLLLDAGFDGYLAKNAIPSPALVLIDIPGDIPAEYLGYRYQANEKLKAAAPKAQYDEVHHETIRKAIADGIAKFGGKGTTFADGTKVNIVPTEREVPQGALQTWLSEQGDGSIEGFYDPGSKEIWIITKNLSTPERAVFVATAHEVLHAGLRKTIGAENIDPVLRQIHARNKRVREQAAIRMSRGMPLVEAVEEVLADMPDRSEVKGWDKLLKAIRDFLAKIGIVRWTDEQVETLVAASRAAVREGGPQTVANTEEAMAASEKAPVFYSELSRQIAAAKSDNMPAPQWKAWLQNQQGIKKDELQWSGVLDWLSMMEEKIRQAKEMPRITNDDISLEWAAEVMKETNGGKVTKKDLLGYLANNGVQVSEKMLGDERSLTVKEAQEILARGGEVYAVRDDEPDMTMRATLSDGKTLLPHIVKNPSMYTLLEGSEERANRREIGTKFSQYVLPGSKNYRELLLTLPYKGSGELAPSEGFSVRRRASGTFVVEDEDGNVVGTGPTREDALRDSGEAINLAREGATFASSHFDTPNIIAHVRFNERTDANGKRILFLEEIQSDWAQKGKREGFATAKGDGVSVDRSDANVVAILDVGGNRVGGYSVNAAYGATDQQLLDRYNSGVGGSDKRIPAAPFVTKTEAWVALALKRMIRYAADNGFDGIAWTTGEQQAARYDLSKQISKVEYNPAEKVLRAYDLEGYDAIVRSGVTPEQIADYVGKDAAEKLLNAPLGPRSPGGDDKVHAISGDGLKVGGEGMRAFYDKIVPGVVRDVLKKVGGGKVEMVNIPATNSKWGGEGALRVHQTSSPPMRGKPWLVQRRVGNKWQQIGGYFSSQGQAAAYLEMLAGEVEPGAGQPGFYLAPEMKAKAQQGMPLFSKRTEESISAGEEADLDFTPRGLADIAGQMKAAKGAMKQKRVDEFASSRDMARPLQLLKAIATDKDAFQYGDSTSTDIQQIAKDMGLTSIAKIEDLRGLEGYIKITMKGDRTKRVAILDPDGTEKVDDNGEVQYETKNVPMVAKMYVGMDKLDENQPAEKTTYLDTSDLRTGKGGKEVYQLAYTWAARNGYVQVPDPSSVSPMATEARIGNMISAAMRLGTTKFMWPVENTDVNPIYGWQLPEWQKRISDGWKYVTDPGNEADLHNQRLLAAAAIGIAEHKLAYGNGYEKDSSKKFRDPQTGRLVKLEDFEYNFDYDEIVWRDDGDPVAKPTLDALLERLLPVGTPPVRGGREGGRPGGKSGPEGAGATDVAQAGRALGPGPRATLARALVLRSANELSPQDVSRLSAGFAGAERPASGTPREGILASRRPDWVESGSAAIKSAASKVDTYAPDKTFKQKVDELKTNWAERFIQGVFDAYAPLQRLGRKEYLLARMVKSADASLEATLLYGKPRMGDDGVIHGALDGKGFLGYMQDLQGEHDRFFLWVAGQRAARLMREGRENLFTPEEIADMRKLDEGKMNDGSSRKQAYAKSQEALNAYNKSVLDIAEKTGLIDGESRKMWEHEFYVPFFRVNDDMKIDGPAKVKGLVRQKAFEKLKGGKENLGDLLDNTLRNWSHLLSASLANQAALANLKAAAKAGIATEVPESAAKDMVKSAGVGGATFAMEDGVKHWYIVDDAQVLDAISAVESASFKGLPMELMGKFKHYLTLGVTASPTFRVRNLMRDSISAIAQSDLSYNVAGNVWKGFRATDRKSKEYAEALFNGALIRFGQLTDGKHAEHAKRLILSGVDDATILDTPQKAKAALGAMWDWWQETGDRAENVNRMSRYMQGLARGESALEAAFASRDMMDFSLQGSWAATRFLTQIVPFMNARLQGMYKLGRAAKEDPARMGYVVGATALLSIALLLAYKDDDEWKKREDWDRDNYWWFRIGDKAFRIPKPFEIGAMGTLAERSVEMAISDEMTGKRFGERLRSMLGDTLALNPTPQLFKPMIDVYANKDSFSGRMIESRGMENLTKPERSGPNTSLVAKTLGKAGEATQLSPAQIDFLIKSYFGWLGSHAAMTVDLMAQPFMDVEKPARKLDDVFVLGDFVKALPAGQSRYVEDFYKQAKVVHEVMGDLKRAREIHDMEKVREIMEERRDDIALARLYTGTQRRIGEVNKRIQIVRNSNLSGELKRQRLDELEERRALMAEQVEKIRIARQAAKRSPALSE